MRLTETANCSNASLTLPSGRQRLPAVASGCQRRPADESRLGAALHPQQAGGSSVTERVYRKQLRPVIQTGATAMDTLFGDDLTEGGDDVE